MNTIFEIKNLKGKVEFFSTEVEGVGQATCSAILKQYPNKKVILQGFRSPGSDTFIPVRL